MRILLLVLLLSGCATADRAQLADGITTVVGFESGFSEANPIWGDVGWPAIIAAKIAVTQAFKFAPTEYCYSGLVSLTAAGYGAASLNISTMLAGTFWYGVPVIIAVGIWQWENWKKDAEKTCLDPWNYTDSFSQLPSYFKDNNR